MTDRLRDFLTTQEIKDLCYCSEEDLIAKMRELDVSYQAIGRLSRLMKEKELSVGALAEFPTWELKRSRFVGERTLEKADKAIVSLLRIQL